jgi:hypothetical protein
MLMLGLKSARFIMVVGGCCFRGGGGVIMKKQNVLQVTP